MADTLKMYSLKPIQEPNIVFHYNSAMYGMKNIVDSLPVKTGSINKLDDIYSELDSQQTVIFDHIKAIKKHIEELRQILLKRSGKNLSDINSKSKSSADEMNLSCGPSVKSGITHEVVLNADVYAPPFSLLGLHHLTKDSIAFKVSFHHHSSLTSLPKSLEQFDRLNKCVVNGGPVIDIRLIWKNSGGTSVVLGHVPLFGEVSLLRFIHSCLNTNLDASNEAKLQELLDQLHNVGSESFETIVNDTEHLISKRLTVLDIALWSSLKTSKPSGKLQRWFQHFDKLLSK